jgi:DNA mismatch repair protein MutS2
VHKTVTTADPNSDRPNPQSVALSALEWPRFITLASEEARSLSARSAVLRLSQPAAFAPDLESARLRQLETEETFALLNREKLWGPLSELASPDEPLQRLTKPGAVLELEELVTLRRWIQASEEWRSFSGDLEPQSRFARATKSLPPLESIVQQLDRVLTPEGALSERASPKLAQLHQEIRTLKKEIHTVLDHLVKTLHQKGILQENFSDVRDGRYVVPVKISQQNEIEGIIYEASASRQTVFVEPREVSALNNRLRQRQNDLVQETFRILQETTELVRPFTSDITFSTTVLTHWDATQARARFGNKYRGMPIEVVADRKFELIRTAHPLLYWTLEAEQIIRNDVQFGSPAAVRTLMLTGPNTGGKTVLLKTLGLAGICARTGFPFPGLERAVVPFFDSFFADLGDAQSIEQHLSSFSGHVLRFREILEHMTSQSLVLIDELNTATDPEEGAALGRAFLETVMKRDAIVVTTTHDPNLKALSISDPRILTASMAFDESSRTPTYRIIPGVPGRSRAIETAERLGIPSEVLVLARSYLSQGHREFEAMLSHIEVDRDAIARDREEARSLREEAEKLKKTWTERTQESLNEVVEKTRQKLRKSLEQAQEEIRNAVRRLEESKSRTQIQTERESISGTFRAATSALEDHLNEIAPELRTPTPQEKEKSGTEQTKLLPGVKVRVAKFKTIGVLISIQGDKAKVALGNLQMQLPLDEIEALSERALPPEFKRNQAAERRRIEANRPPAPPQTLDLRGRRFEEGMSELEHWIDLAYRSGAWKEVTVVHGFGTGALREGTRKILSQLPYIKEYRDAGQGQGGTGATLVEFDL